MEQKLFVNQNRPWYVSTGRIVDKKENYVASTKTKELAEKIVKALNTVEQPDRTLYFNNLTQTGSRYR